MTSTLDTTTDGIDPAEALLRATFAAAAENVPNLGAPDFDAAAVVPLVERRRRPARWAAAAAAVALLAGTAAWGLDGTDHTQDVATVPTTISRPDPHSQFTPFGEPTWVPPGVVPVVMWQVDGPPAYTADVVTADGTHATLHWIDAPDRPAVGWDDGRAHGDAVHLVGSPADEGFQAWGEPTPAPYVIRADSPRTPPTPASADTISALLEDLLHQCRLEYTCRQFRVVNLLGVLDGARVVRQGPDGSNIGQTRISYDVERGNPTFSVATWTTTGVIPEGRHPVPVVGVYPPPVDEPGFESEPMTVDDRPALFMAGPDQSSIVVEYPELGLTVAVASTRTSGRDDSTTTDPLDRGTLTRISASIRIRPASAFESTARSYYDDVSGARLATIDSGSLVYDVVEFTGPTWPPGCPVLAVARSIGVGGNSFGGDACARQADGKLDPVELSGVDTHDGTRRWLGTYDEQVERVRIRMADGVVIERPTVPIPDHPNRLIAVDLPAGAGTVELLGPDDTVVTTSKAMSFQADDRMTFG